MGEQPATATADADNPFLPEVVLQRWNDYVRRAYPDGTASTPLDSRAALARLALAELDTLRAGLVPEARIDALCAQVTRVSLLVQALGAAGSQPDARARKGGLVAKGQCLASERHPFEVALAGAGLDAPSVRRQVVTALTSAVNVSGCPSCSALGRRRRRTRVVWTLVEAADG